MNHDPVILDAHGRPMRREDPPMFVEVGSSGLRRFGGFIREEWHRDLQGRRGVQVYREMSDNHPIIGATFLAMEMLARQVTYRVDATGDTPQHVEAADFCQTVIDDVQGGMTGIISNGMTMLPFGWAWMEKVFKVSRGNHSAQMFNSKFDDGKVRWSKLAIRAQESLFNWEFDDSGEATAMIQTAAPDFRQRRIPRSKSLHFRLLNRKNNPEGHSLLRAAYTSYYFQKHMQFTEAVGVERNLAGFPKIQLPPSYFTDASKKSELKKWTEMGEKTRVDEVATWVVPAEEDRDGKSTGFKSELISASGKNVADTDPIIKRYASWIAISLIAKFMMLGVDKHGSFALAESDTDLFALAEAAVIDMILQPINEEGFPELLELNGMRREVAPKLMHGDIEKVDMVKLTGAINTAVGGGIVIPDNPLEDFVREQLSVPKAERVEGAERPALPTGMMGIRSMFESLRGGNGNGASATGAGSDVDRG